jgi:DNA-binding MarR family transcriptional regulator
MLDMVNDIVYYNHMKQARKYPDDWKAQHSGKESHLLREIIKTNQALMNTVTRKVGMSSGRLVLLRLLAVNYPEPIGTLDIARQLGVNAAAITRLLKQMETDQLISRLPDKHDHRRINFCISKKGLQAFRVFHQRSHDFEKALEKKISREDLAIANKVLMQVRESIENMTRGVFDE